MITNGRYLCIRCPWEHLHTTQSDKTATVWFLAGSGGIEQSAFSCRHAHCAHRTTAEFLREVGYDEEGFEEIGPPVIRREGLSLECLSEDNARPWHPRGSESAPTGAVHSTNHAPHQRRPSTALEGSLDEEERTLAHDPLHRLPATPMAHPRAALPEDDASATLTAFDAHVAPDRPVVVAGGAGHPLDSPPFERTKDGKIKPLLHNIVQALERPDLCGAIIGRDEFKDEIVWRPWVRHTPWLPGPDTFQHPQIRPFKDSDYVSINVGMRQLGFGPGDIPLQAFRLALNSVADRRAFDSAITWIQSLPPWDGVHRIDTFCSAYLGSEDTPYTRAVGRYWWTAHAGRVIVPGIQADMAVVLVSTQGTYKTSCLRELVPHEDHYVELDLVARDEDLCRKMRGKLIGEMAELRGINSKDIEAIKAWVSRRREEWVPKYLEFSRSFPRRLVLVGTSNQDEFLADETGNRRWLPMVVGDRQAIDALRRDRLQLWAEAYELYLGNGIFWSEAEQLARHQHGAFMIQHEWEFSIHEWLHTMDDFAGGRPIDREYLLLHDIAKGALGIQTDKLNMSTQFQVSKILRKMGFAKFHKRINGKFCKVWQKGSFRWEDRSVQRGGDTS